MPVPFGYRRIGQGLYDELVALTVRRESAVLLGLRDIGKRYALRVLTRRLRDEGTALLIDVEFPHEPPLAESASVRRAIQVAATRSAPDFPFREFPTPTLLSPLEQLCDGQSRRVVLLASNVDSIAHHLAQRFLREVRVLVEKHDLTVVLTGEENLGELVYGPESDFTCAHYFVVQGFEETAFIEYMRRRKEIAQVRFADELSSLQTLFAQTGGNIRLARAVLWAWCETQARQPNWPGTPVSSEDFRAFVDGLPVSEACDVDVFSQTVRAIEGVSGAWRDLEGLLKGTEAVAVSAGAEPHPLELAGMAARDGDRLGFASPIMERFARCYYDDCRLGDLHAVNGDWDVAFEFYQRMSLERRVRPCGADDRTRLVLVVKALAGRLHEEVTRSRGSSSEKLDRVKRFFMKGCELVLGVPDITFWTYAGHWRLQDGQTPGLDLSGLATGALAAADRDRVGWQRVPPPFNQRMHLALLPAVCPDQRDAVVVCGTHESVAISRERAELLRELLEQFASAYDHTVAGLRNELRLEAREKHLAVATSIVDAIGSSVQNPGQALKLAGEALLKLGYRRIVFSLVDPERKRVTGIRDCVGEASGIDIAAMTDYPLDKPEVDIQPWVVANKRACVVPDWRAWVGEPGIQPDLYSRAGTGSFAVVPMFMREPIEDGTVREVVLGTIHVERHDRLPLSTDDIEDLLEFGRQFAAAANQSIRVYELLNALALGQDAMLILDRHGRVLFANRAGGQRFRVKEGWHDALEGVVLDAQKHRQLVDDIRSVVSRGGRIVRHEVSSQEGTLLREAIVCEPLPDWRSPNLSSFGAVVIIRDLTPLHRIFTALQQVADATEDREATIRALLGCVRDLGYRSARLYLAERHAEDVLTSVRSMGLPPEYGESFDQGAYRMDRSAAERSETWLPLETGEPRVCKWDPDLATGKAEPTEHGLAVFNIQSPAFEKVGRRPGDLWIDLPLVANQRPIGKLTIDCGTNRTSDLKPEDLELLGLFSASLGALLDALDRKERWVRDAADKAMATCAHNIRTKLAALDGFADRYQRAAPRNAKVRELNQLHQPAVDGCFRQVTRIKETFAGIQLERTPTRLKPLLEATVDGVYGKDQRARRVTWVVHCPEDLMFSLDADRIRNAVEEMLHNSREMVPPNRKLEVELRVELQQRGPRQWLRLALYDTGPGVPPDKRELIFEPFYSDRPYGKRSTGLGLNLVRRVVEAHGGKVWVTGESGHGAEFVIEIPDEGGQT